MYVTFVLTHSAFEPDPYNVCRGRFTKVEAPRSDEESLDDIFRATNNIDESWTQRDPPGIEFEVNQAFRDRGCRSTSVGDSVTLMDWDGKNSRTYRCAPIGWTRV